MQWDVKNIQDQANVLCGLCPAVHCKRRQKEAWALITLLGVPNFSSWRCFLHRYSLLNCVQDEKDVQAALPSMFYISTASRAEAQRFCKPPMLPSSLSTVSLPQGCCFEDWGELLLPADTYCFDSSSRGWQSPLEEGLRTSPLLYLTVNEEPKPRQTGTSFTSASLSWKREYTCPA